MGYLLTAIVISILILIYAYMKQFAIKFGIIQKAVLALTIVLFTLCVIIYPEESFNAAFEGLNIWFNVVCPSLLPFFIGSELLINLGIVNFLGIILEPVMRPLFNVPGCGSFAFVMSITSGYPVGSKIIAELYYEKMCTKVEAQRLLSFCSTSGPLFMIGAVAVGMLGVKSSGPIIALSHYIGALTVGLIFRYYKYKDRTPVLSSSSSFKKAFIELYHSFSQEKRPFGLLLSNSVKNSVNTVLTIGGFMVLFSVIIRLMLLSGVISSLSHSLCYVLYPLIDIDKQFMNSVISGLFEITIGSKLIAASKAALDYKIIAICFVISWSGISILAQVASMISNTDLKMTTYILSKALHSFFSCIYAYIFLSIWELSELFNNFPVFSNFEQQTFYNSNWLSVLMTSSQTFISSFIFIIFIAFMYYIINKIMSAFNY